MPKLVITEKPSVAQSIARRQMKQGAFVRQISKRYNFMGVMRVVPCLCKCDQAAMEARKEEGARREFAIRVQSLKTIGLTENRFHEWCFENDNGKNPKINLARRYVKDWKMMQEKNIGYIVVEEQEFAESKAAIGNGGQNNYSRSSSAATSDADEFMNIPEGIDDELPFS